MIQSQSQEIKIKNIFGHPARKGQTENSRLGLEDKLRLLKIDLNNLLKTSIISIYYPVQIVYVNVKCGIYPFIRSGIIITMLTTKISSIQSGNNIVVKSIRRNKLLWGSMCWLETYSKLYFV